MEISILHNMRWKKFAFGAGMLAVLGIVGKVIGVFYRLPLTNVLGAEGMGLYQMIFPLYSLILAVSCGGLPAAISKYVSELVAVGNRHGARQALKISVCLLTILSVIVAILIAAFRVQIASLQGNIKASIAYLAIAPAIIFSGIIACFRGYFQGLMNMLPSGISQVVEQVVKVIVGLLLAFAMVDKGVEYGVFGALIGVSVSEVVAVAYLAVRFVISKRHGEQKDDIAQKIKVSAVIKSIYAVALPVTLGSLVMPLSQVVDSFLVINLLCRNGHDTTSATALFGLFNGPVGSLLSVPMVVSVALSTSLLPKIAFSISKGEDAMSAIDKAMSFCLAFMLPCAIVFALAPTFIMKILYSRGLSESELQIASTLLRIESINLVLLGVIQLSSAMLQGKSKAKIPVINLMIGAIVKVAITLITTRFIGIYGAAISNVACYGVTCALDVRSAKRYYGNYISFKKHAKILFCASFFALALCIQSLLGLFMNGVFAFIIALAIAGVGYFTLLLKTKCILLSEMLS